MQNSFLFYGFSLAHVWARPLWISGPTCPRARPGTANWSAFSARIGPPRVLPSQTLVTHGSYWDGKVDRAAGWLHEHTAQSTRLSPGWLCDVQLDCVMSQSPPKSTYSSSSVRTTRHSRNFHLLAASFSTAVSWEPFNCAVREGGGTRPE